MTVRLNASVAPALAITTARDGRTTQVPLQRDGDEYFADLTDWADLHYEYELTISVPSGQTLRGLAVDTWCQASAMTLPRWFEPGCSVRLQAGCAWDDLQGRAVLPHLVDLIEELRIARVGARLDKGQLNDSATLKILPQDGQIQAIVAVAPPMPGRIVRLHAMAGVQAAREPAVATGEVAIEMAIRPEGPFRVIGCGPVVSDPDAFHFCVEALATLPSPEPKVWLRLRSPQPVGVWRVRLDYEPEIQTAGAGCATHGGMAARGVGLPAAPEDRPLHLLLRWRQDTRLRMYLRRFFPQDLDKPFTPVTEPGSTQPLHLVLSVPSNDRVVTRP